MLRVGRRDPESRNGLLVRSMPSIAPLAAPRSGRDRFIRNFRFGKRKILDMANLDQATAFGFAV
jgi:hypothetical protein